MCSFHERYKKQIEALAGQMRTEQLPPLTEELFALFETTGNRLKYEEVYFKRRKFLAVFGMAACIFKRRADVEKLSEVLLEVCEEECWALPAHVNRATDVDWRNTVDLFASETAQTLAEIITFVNGELPKESRLPETVCERVRKEIECRIFQPFFESEPNYGCWECADHNWNAVCAGSIGSACIYLMEEKEKERLDVCLKRLCHSLDYYLKGFREDGACMEGIGYFTYGMTYFVGFAEQLLRYSGRNINLFANEKLRKIAEFQQKNYFQSGQTISFSDGDMQARFRMGLTSYLAEQYDTVKIPEESLACDFESDSCYRFMGLMRDYLWTKEERKNRAELLEERKAARHDVLSSAQWSICESENGAGFAIKGGDNGEPHNHNDVGSFLYLLRGEQLITDLGAGEYTKEYFGAGRYEILCNSSLGHSVPIINGKLQCAGKEYRASYFFADGAGTTELEFAGAYGNQPGNKLVRKAEFSLKDGSLTITDSFTLDDKAESFTEQLVTQGEVKPADGVIWMKGKKESCKILLPKEAERLRVIEEVHSNHEGVPETVYLVQWEIPLGPNKKNSTWIQIIPLEKC